MDVCFVVNCMAKYSIDKKIKFHKFPENPELKKRWQLAVGRTDHTPGPYNLICSEHFTENDYFLSEFNNKQVLKPDAIPTVFENDGTKNNDIEKIEDSVVSSIEEEEIIIKVERPDMYENNIKEDPLMIVDNKRDNSVLKPLQQSEMVLRPRKARKSYLSSAKAKKPQNKKSKLQLKPKETLTNENIPPNNLPVKKITCYYNKEDIPNNGDFSELLDKEILPILKKIGPTVPDNSIIYLNKNPDDVSSRSIDLNNALKQNNVIIIPYVSNENLVAENNGPIISEKNNENTYFPVVLNNNEESVVKLQKCDEEKLLANKLTYCDSCVSRKRKFECVQNKYKEESAKYKKYWINSQKDVKTYTQEIAKLKRVIRSKNSTILVLNAQIRSFTQNK